MQSIMKIRHLRKLNKPILLLGTSLSLAACSLTNPYVDEATLVDETETKTCPFVVSSMDQALKCSASIKSKYIESMGQQANLSAWTGIGLIPLTTFTIGFAANGESASKISDFALGSAGIFSLSSWLSSSDRTKIFALGQKAILCAEKVVQPMMIDSTSLGKLTTSLTNLDKHIGLVTSHIRFVNASAALVVDGDASKIRALAYISETEKSIAEAVIVQQNASNILRQFHNAPNQLLITVRDVNAHVNEALSSTIQSLSALPGVLAGMGNLYTDNKATYSSFFPQTEDSGIEYSGTKEIQGLNEAAKKAQKEAAAMLLSHLKELTEDTATLDHNVNQLKSLVNRYRPDASNKTLESCGIDTSNIGTSINITPAILSFVEKSKSLKTVAITGGNGMFGLPSNPNLEIAQARAFGGLISIKLNDNTPVGNHPIVIQDSAGRSAVLTVTVTAVQKIAKTDIAGNANSPEADSAKASNSVLCSKPEDLKSGEEAYCKDSVKTKELQDTLVQELSLDPKFADGDYGEETRTQIKVLFNNVAFSHLKSGQAEVPINPVTLQSVIDYNQQKQLTETDIEALIKPLTEGDSRTNKLIEFQLTYSIKATGFLGETTLEKLCETYPDIVQCK